ncbi:MAG: hypothetical protein ACRDJ5_10500 [Actinomycetota bacterium]
MNKPRSGGEITDSVDYLEHLTDGDLRLLAGIVAGEGGAEDLLRRLRADPQAVGRALSDGLLWDRLFGRAARRDPLAAASPFLVFAVIVHRARLELARSNYVEEAFGPRRRLPVFDVGSLTGFLEDDERRLFLIELLASFTHVASGSVLVRSRKGWRRHRFSELDPVRLASLLDVLPEAERPGLYRRLGDLSLFLTGVFPDRSFSTPPASVGRQRLLRTLGGVEENGGLSPSELADLERDPSDAVMLLEFLGRRWYRLALAAATPPLTSKLRLAQLVADRFTDARRVLNFITDRYLFPHRVRWFPDSPN